MARPLRRTPNITAKGKTMGRPRLPLRADSIAIAEDLAAKGCGVVGISMGLGISPDTLRRWLDETPELRDAIAIGRERERHLLHTKLREKAAKGDTIALLFLLKAAHGYTEGTDRGAVGGVHVTITLPGAKSAEQYIAEVTPDAEAQRIPAARS